MIRNRTRIFPLYAALLIALAWPVHEVFAHHAGDNDCQVCSISGSPQLNSDCGTELLSVPVNFEIVNRVFFIRPFPAAPKPAFQGRAPPLA